MANKTLKTLGGLVAGIGLVVGLNSNSFGQDTIRTADGYAIKDNNKGYLICDVKIRENGKDVYGYSNGKLKELEIFREGRKTQSYLYNKKGQLITETIFNKEGKVKEVIDRRL